MVDFSQRNTFSNRQIQSALHGATRTNALTKRYLLHVVSVYIQTQWTSKRNESNQTTCL